MTAKYRIYYHTRNNNTDMFVSYANTFRQAMKILYLHIKNVSTVRNTDTFTVDRVEPVPHCVFTLRLKPEDFEFYKSMSDDAITEAADNMMCTYIRLGGKDKYHNFTEKELINHET